MSKEGMIVNKYGAVDVKEIIALRTRIRRLEFIIESIAGVQEYNSGNTRLDNIWRAMDTIKKVKNLPEDFQKMKILTKCDDYEFETIPEKKQLVKKVFKEKVNNNDR